MAWTTRKLIRNRPVRDMTIFLPMELFKACESFIFGCLMGCCRACCPDSIRGIGHSDLHYGSVFDKGASLGNANGLIIVLGPDVDQAPNGFPAVGKGADTDVVGGFPPTDHPARQIPAFGLFDELVLCLDTGDPIQIGFDRLLHFLW